MSKPENAMLNRVRKELEPLGYYTEKITPVYSNGTPDLYIEKQGVDAFCEGKFIPRKTIKVGDQISAVSAANQMTALQKAWAVRRINNGLKFFLLVGYGSYTYAMFTFLQRQPELTVTGGSFVRSKQSIIEDIEAYMNESQMVQET